MLKVFLLKSQFDKYIPYNIIKPFTLVETTDGARFNIFPYILSGNGSGRHHEAEPEMNARMRDVPKQNGDDDEDSK